MLERHEAKGQKKTGNNYISLCFGYMSGNISLVPVVMTLNLKKYDRRAVFLNLVLRTTCSYEHDMIEMNV